ncbi:hypothetical protein [Pseudoxanthomonas sp. UTMC 1351]|uniref:hypothetical protein n=1 Tax=Pseudoxanthomonas sp. UTMC 1351 TaxID=2695853 RepID=UPI0034D016CF
MKSCILYLTSRSWHALERGRQRVHASGSIDAGSKQPFAALAQWLTSHATGKLRVDVLVSAAAVRFMTLPWSSAAGTGAGIRKRVLQAWERSGLDNSTHDIRIQWPRYGEPIVAVAYPTAWLRSLEAALAAAGVSVGAIGCSAVAIAGRYAVRMPSGPSLLVIEEDDALVGVHLRDGAITDFETLPPDGQGLDEVSVWLHRKQMDLPEAKQMRWFLPSERQPAQSMALLACPDDGGGYGVALLAAVA